MINKTIPKEVKINRCSLITIWSDYQKKPIPEEVKINRCSLITMWSDHQKAFDSIPHEWLVKSFELAKVPAKAINALKEQIKNWATNISLQGNEQLIETNFIHQLRDIFQGHSQPVLQFILCPNPLRFSLKKLKG